MNDKCTDVECSATVTYSKRWYPVKGKDIEVMTGRCPDCGANYTKTRRTGTNEPGTVAVVAAANR
jgi:hypothetical protein